jgi:hypothetical protein
MDAVRPARIPVVTDRAHATPALLDAVRDRARRGSVEFRVLVPNPSPAERHPLHPGRHVKLEEAERRLHADLAHRVAHHGLPVTVVRSGTA